MEEVKSLIWVISDLLTPWQNLREEVAMGVDDDEEGTQQPKKVQDYGIEIDFDALDDEERDVSMGLEGWLCQV